jgi:hypothetical protein
MTTTILNSQLIKELFVKPFKLSSLLFYRDPLRSVETHKMTKQDDHEAVDILKVNGTGT